MFVNFYLCIIIFPEAPITTEIIFLTKRSCEAISSKEVQNATDDLFRIINTTLGNLTFHNISLKVNLLSHQFKCNPRIDNRNNELIFSYNFKRSSEYGACREACAVLGIIESDNRCLDLCKKKAKPTENQVRHLTTSYTARTLKSLDVSTVGDILQGAKFKLLNATSKDFEAYSPTNDDVFSIIHDFGTTTYYPFFTTTTAV